MTDFFIKAQFDPFVWGENDCALWVASYVFEVTGFDPAAALRGRYKTALGCKRLLNREGGLLALSDRLMADFDDGVDVGVFEIQCQQVAGIIKGDRVGIKSETGLHIFLRPKLLKGWSLCRNY